jgi:hypothetical protein
MTWKATALEDLQRHLLWERERYEKFSVFAEHEGGKMLLDELISEVSRRAQEERTTEWACADCGRPAPIHVFVQESDWRQIRPRHDGQGGVLCLYCMCERLTGVGYADGELRGSITFSNGPFSAFKAAASGIETEGQDGATRHGAEHESEGGDAIPSAPLNHPIKE